MPCFCAGPLPVPPVSGHHSGRWMLMHKHRSGSQRREMGSGKGACAMEGCHRTRQGLGGSEKGLGQTVLGRGNSMCRGLVSGGNVMRMGLKE